METGVQIRNIVVIFVCLTVLGFFICIASLGAVSAEPVGPDFYYYYNGRKIRLTLSKEKLAVRFKQALTLFFLDTDTRRRGHKFTRINTDSSIVIDHGFGLTGKMCKNG